MEEQTKLTPGMARAMVQGVIDRRTLLEQLAEEASELSQAALKLIRAIGLSDNPTPMSVDEAWRNLEEEAADVAMVLNLLPSVHHAAVEDNAKWVRWAERLTENRLPKGREHR